MTDNSISPLRQRMIEDMTVRGFTPGTQRVYLAAVSNLTTFIGRLPDQAEADVGGVGANNLMSMPWGNCSKLPGSADITGA